MRIPLVSAFGVGATPPLCAMLNFKLNTVQLKAENQGCMTLLACYLVSADIGFKINYQISASTLIPTEIITDKITGCCFLD